MSESDVALLMGGLLPHTLAVCARWRLRDESTGELAPVDESVPPHGETLLHACAFAGASCAIANELLEQLLHAGAFANRRGELSGCTALHAAASGGSTAACRLLLGAGCKPEILSSGRRSALSSPPWTGCCWRSCAIPPSPPSWAQCRSCAPRSSAPVTPATAGESCCLPVSAIECHGLRLIAIDAPATFATAHIALMIF